MTYSSRYHVALFGRSVCADDREPTAMSVDIYKLAERYREAVRLGNADAIAEEIIDTYGHEIAQAAFDEADRRARLDWEEAQARYKAWQEQYADAQMIFDGLPKDISLAEACRIKAERGDPLAQRYLHWLNSRSYRLFSALYDAAIERHSGYQHTSKHSWRKIDPAAPDENELVEWFQKNYPAEARAIEAEIDADDAGDQS
jgi:hypothetical protein